MAHCHPGRVNGVSHAGRDDLGYRLIEAAPPGVIAEFLDYWEAKRGGRSLPARRDLDPVDIPRLLPFVTLADIEPEPFRVRYRLAGTMVVETTGMEITGRYLDELAPPHVLASYHAIYRRCCEHFAPSYASVDWEFTADRRGSYEIGAFPLSSDGARVDMVLTVEDYGTLKYEYGPGRSE